MDLYDAKRAVVAYLDEVGRENVRVKAKTLSFEDLARAERVLVTLIGAPAYGDRAFWQPLQDLAQAGKFSVERA